MKNLKSILLKEKRYIIEDIDFWIEYYYWWIYNKKIGWRLTGNVSLDIVDKIEVVYYKGNILLFEKWNNASIYAMEAPDIYFNSEWYNFLKKHIENKIKELNENKLKKLNKSLNSCLNIISSKFVEIVTICKKNDLATELFRVEFANMMSKTVNELINPTNKILKLFNPLKRFKWK